MRGLVSQLNSCRWARAGRSADLQTLGEGRGRSWPGSFPRLPPGLLTPPGLAKDNTGRWKGSTCCPRSLDHVASPWWRRWGMSRTRLVQSPLPRCFQSLPQGGSSGGQQGRAESGSSLFPDCRGSAQGRPPCTAGPQEHTVQGWGAASTEMTQGRGTGCREVGVFKGQESPWAAQERGRGLGVRASPGAGAGQAGEQQRGV